MEWISASSRSTMVEQAKEELQMLETQHPNRFDYLKDDLKSFILLVESQNLCNSVSLPTCSTTSTQGSSTSRKKTKKGSSQIERKMEDNFEASKQKVQRARASGYPKRDRVDDVIKRAEACIHKIKQFKTSF